MRGIARGKIAAAHICAHALVIHMFAPADEHFAVGVHFNVKIDKAHGFAAGVKRNVYARAVGRRVRSVAHAHARKARLVYAAAHVAVFPERHGRILHGHTYFVVFGAGPVNALRRHAHICARLKQHTLYGARMQFGGHVVNERRICPVLRLRARVVFKRIAHLMRNAVDRAGFKARVRSHLSRFTAEREYMAALRDFVNQSRTARTVYRAVYDLAVRDYAQFVFAGAHVF